MSQTKAISVTHVTEIARLGVGRLDAPNTLSSSLTDASGCLAPRLQPPSTLGLRVAVAVGDAVRVEVYFNYHLAYSVRSVAVLGRYGNVNALPPSLADQPPKV